MSFTSMGGLFTYICFGLKLSFFGMTKPWATSPDGYRVPAAFSLHSIDVSGDVFKKPCIFSMSFFEGPKKVCDLSVCVCVSIFAVLPCVPWWDLLVITVQTAWGQGRLIGEIPAEWAHIWVPLKIYIQGTRTGIPLTYRYPNGICCVL